MADPLGVLDEFARLLRPDGVLLLSVPDFSSPEAAAGPSAWFHLDVPRHLAHFPAEVLRAELKRRGFIVERESFFAHEYDAFSLTQTWQNRLGLPPNLLYLLLKSARRVSGPEPTLAQRLTAMLLAVPLLPLAVLVTLWRAARKKGAVIVLLARRT
jgi:SAM-dependent methyltransferase